MPNKNNMLSLSSLPLSAALKKKSTSSHCTFFSLQMLLFYNYMVLGMTTTTTTTMMMMTTIISTFLIHPTLSFSPITPACHRPSYFPTSTTTTATVTNTHTRSCTSTSALGLSASSSSSQNNNNNHIRATLTEETTWRLRLSLNGVPTVKGKKVGEWFNVDIQFVQQDGYEPPQGIIRQILPTDTDTDTDTEITKKQARFLQIQSGRWQLSEDPQDRKDGLWIWGLFEEPLYPFLLLQLETEEYALEDSSTTADANATDRNVDAIQPLKLYAQINHKRDKRTGQVELEAATLNLREFESVKADPFGAARVDIYEEIKCGQLTLRPLLSSVESKVDAIL